MKKRKAVVITSWCLLIITGLSGLGITHLFEHSFDPLTHVMLSALGQLLPLAIGTPLAAFATVAHLTVGAFRDWLLSDLATTDALTALAPGVTPEMAAAVSKISSLQDLMVIAAKCRVVTSFRNTIGLHGCLSVRLAIADR